MLFPDRHRLRIRTPEGIVEGFGPVPAAAIDAVRPDDLLILPWNLREEIMAQTGRIRAWGGRFVTASPEPRTWD
jgi:hypothetical protein